MFILGLIAGLCLGIYSTESQSCNLLINGVSHEISWENESELNIIIEGLDEEINPSLWDQYGASTPT